MQRVEERVVGSPDESERSRERRPLWVIGRPHQSPFTFITNQQPVPRRRGSVRVALEEHYQERYIVGRYFVVIREPHEVLPSCGPEEKHEIVKRADVACVLDILEIRN